MFSKKRIMNKNSSYFRWISYLVLKPPLWTICASQIGNRLSPRIRVENSKKSLSTHHPVIPSRELTYPTWGSSENHRLKLPSQGGYMWTSATSSRYPPGTTNIAGWKIHHEWVDVFPIGILVGFPASHVSLLEGRSSHSPRSFLLREGTSWTSHDRAPQTAVTELFRGIFHLFFVDHLGGDGVNLLGGISQAKNSVTKWLGSPWL